MKNKFDICLKCKYIFTIIYVFFFLKLYNILTYTKNLLGIDEFIIITFVSFYNWYNSIEEILNKRHFKKWNNNTIILFIVKNSPEIFFKFNRRKNFTCTLADEFLCACAQPLESNIFSCPLYIL